MFVLQSYKSFKTDCIIAFLMTNKIWSPHKTEIKKNNEESLHIMKRTVNG